MFSFRKVAENYLALIRDQKRSLALTNGLMDMASLQQGKTTCVNPGTEEKPGNGITIARKN
jgi:hypothetical protein